MEQVRPPKNSLKFHDTFSSHVLIGAITTLTPAIAGLMVPWGDKQQTSSSILGIVILLLICFALGALLGAVSWYYKQRSFASAGQASHVAVEQIDDLEVRAFLENKKRITKLSLIYFIPSLFLGFGVTFILARYTTFFENLKSYLYADYNSIILEIIGGLLMGLSIPLMAISPLLLYFYWLYKYSKNLKMRCTDCNLSFWEDTDVSKYVVNYMICPKCGAKASNQRLQRTSL